MFHGGFLCSLLRPRLLFIMYMCISIIISLCIYLSDSIHLYICPPTYLSAYLYVSLSLYISIHLSISPHLYLSMSLYLLLSGLIFPCLIISYVWYRYLNLFTYMILQVCSDLASSFHFVVSEASEKRCQKVMPLGCFCLGIWEY